MTKKSNIKCPAVIRGPFPLPPNIPGKTVTLLAGRNISERTVTAMEGNLRCE